MSHERCPSQLNFIKADGQLRLPGTMSSADVAKLKGAALELFFALARRLELSPKEQAILLGVTRGTLRLYASKRGFPRSRDTIERISHLASIWTRLSSLFSSEGSVVHWLKTPNRLLGESTPLDRMLAGNVADIIYVRNLAETVAS